jgi:hypothetical protein
LDSTKRRLSEEDERGGGESEIIKKGEGEEGETDRQITSKRE